MRAWIGLCLLLFVMAMSPAQAGSFVIGAGGLSGVSTMAELGPETSLAPAIGFTAYGGYRMGRWMPAAEIMASFAGLEDADFSAAGSFVSGDLSKRRTGMGISARYFPDCRLGRWSCFLMGGLMATTNEILTEANHIQLPAVSGGQAAGRAGGESALRKSDRIFVRGGGVMAGLGLQPENSRFYLQLNYSYDRFWKMVVVETRNSLRQVRFEEESVRRIEEHSILLTFGLTNIF